LHKPKTRNSTDKEKAPSKVNLDLTRTALMITCQNAMEPMALKELIVADNQTEN
jgi:hypothetical protein